MKHENLINPKQSLIDVLSVNKVLYKEAILRFVIGKQNNVNLLHWGRIDFPHRNETTQKEETIDYGDIVLIKRIFTLDEIISFIEKLPSDTIEIKDVGKVFIKGDFERSQYHIPSNTHYLGIFEKYPVKYYSYRFNHSERLQSTYNFLVKDGLPTYPDLTVATKHFLNLGKNFNLANPFGILFIIPDYKARISSLEIAENNLIAIVEQKESNFDDLLLKIYYRKEENELTLPEISAQNQNIIEIPAFPDELHVYLFDKKTKTVLDYLQYGNYNTENHAGIKIKTSREQIESMLIAKEGTEIEFKAVLDNEFLETVVAFANTDGGTILLGIDNQGNVLGFYDDYANTEKRIRGMISGRCEPQIEVNVQQIDFKDKPLVIVKIKKGIDKPYLVKEDGAYKRIDERDISMNRHDLDAIYSQKQR